MRRNLSRSGVALALGVAATLGLLAAGAANAAPLFGGLFAVPDPTPTLLLGAGLTGLAFQGRPAYHRR